MTQLIDILKKETESLRLQYFAKTEEWAIVHYNELLNRKTWRDAEWCEYFNLTPTKYNEGLPSEFISFPREFYLSKNYKRYHALKDDIRQACRMTLDSYIEKELKYAELHYENSIAKLADRINKKGLNIENLSATTSHIGVNINTTLTDGNKTVRAFTIIASGQIQRPHYRYLIK